MGARQVGKTWLMKNLGKNQFQNTIYINFEREPSYGNLFDSDLNVGRILETISLMYGESITEDWMTNLPLFAIREIARVRRDSASPV